MNAKEQERTTGRGKETPELIFLDEKQAGIIGESLLSGVVTEAEGDTLDDSGSLHNLYSLV